MASSSKYNIINVHSPVTEGHFHTLYTCTCSGSVCCLGMAAAAGFILFTSFMRTFTSILISLKPNFIFGTKGSWLTLTSDFTSVLIIYTSFNIHFLKRCLNDIEQNTWPVISEIFKKVIDWLVLKPLWTHGMANHIIFMRFKNDSYKFLEDVHLQVVRWLWQRWQCS